MSYFLLFVSVGWSSGVEWIWVSVMVFCFLSFEVMVCLKCVVVWFKILYGVIELVY